MLNFVFYTVVYRRRSYGFVVGRWTVLAFFASVFWCWKKKSIGISVLDRLKPMRDGQVVSIEDLNWIKIQYHRYKPANLRCTFFCARIEICKQNKISPFFPDFPNWSRQMFSLLVTHCVSHGIGAIAWNMNSNGRYIISKVRGKGLSWIHSHNLNLS